jgi:hypothetical protein
VKFNGIFVEALVTFSSPIVLCASTKDVFTNKLENKIMPNIAAAAERFRLSNFLFIVSDMLSILNLPLNDFYT